MALNGASQRFIDQTTPAGDLSAASINSLDMGGNVYASPNGGLNVRVTPILGLINNVEIDYAGAATDQVLTNNTTNYIYLNSSGVLVINTMGFPSYPGTKYFPLATVVASSGAISSITDKRWKFFA